MCVLVGANAEINITALPFLKKPGMKWIRHWWMSIYGNQAGELKHTFINGDNKVIPMYSNYFLNKAVA